MNEDQIRRECYERAAQIAECCGDGDTAAALIRKRIPAAAQPDGEMPEYIVPSKQRAPAPVSSAVEVVERLRDEAVKNREACTPGSLGWNYWSGSAALLDQALAEIRSLPPKAEKPDDRLFVTGHFSHPAERAAARVHAALSTPPDNRGEG